MSSQAVVLLSAGLDSAVNLYKAHSEMKVALAVTFDYGQRAASKEIEAAAYLCKELRIPHKVIALPWLAEVTNTSLVNRQKEVPVGNQVSIDHQATSEETKKAVWVPNRNGVLLNVAACLAEAMGADFVIPGFNLEEASTFPDNSREYMCALDKSFQMSTENGVQVKCFTVNMTKPEIVRLGETFSVPFDQLWPCYFSGEKICGQCESCQRFLRAVNQ